ncbi:MAG: sulfurtransferase TusA family protein [bacterium]
MDADATLDAIGVYCPVPIILTTEKMNELKIGQTLEVLADDPDILEDLPNWCKRSGTRFLKLEREDGFYKLYVRKGNEEDK